MEKVLYSFMSVVLGMSLSSQVFAFYPDGTLPDGSHLQPIATITNTRDAATAVMSLILSEEDSVLGIYNVYSPNDEDGTVERNILTMNQIESSEGAILHEESGLKIFILQGHLDSAHGTAALQIRYLTNGIRRSYESCKINAVKSSDGKWSLINAYNGMAVTEIRARTWALGVRTLENVCP